MLTKSFHCTVMPLWDSVPAAERTPEQLAVLHRHFLKQAAGWLAPLRLAASTVHRPAGGVIARLRAR